MNLRDKIEALLNSANAKTGENDTTMTAAVSRLIAGFRTGGSNIQYGSFIPAENLSNYTTNITGTVSNAVSCIVTPLESPGHRWNSIVIKLSDCDMGVIVGTNVSGGSLNGVLRSDAVEFGDGFITLNTYYGNFIAGSEYVWFAW